jgi:hypothetical protein
MQAVSDIVYLGLFGMTIIVTPLLLRVIMGNDSSPVRSKLAITVIIILILLPGVFMSVFEESYGQGVSLIGLMCGIVYAVPAILLAAIPGFLAGFIAWLLGKGRQKSSVKECVRIGLFVTFWVFAPLASLVILVTIGIMQYA